MARWWAASRAEASTRSTCCWTCSDSAGRQQSRWALSGALLARPDVHQVAVLRGEPVEPDLRGALIAPRLVPVDRRERAPHVRGHPARVPADVHHRPRLEELPDLRALP